MSLSRNIIKGSIWTLAGGGLSMIVGLITNIILAQLITPYEFGLVGIIMFFINIANILVESGLGGALVRIENINNIDYSSALVFNVCVSVACFLSVVLLSDKIGELYNDYKIKELLIVSGLIFIINGFNTIQNARLLKEFKFKKKNITYLFSILIASIIAIYCAYYGFGAWSLIYLYLLTALFNFLINYFTEDRSIYNFKFSLLSFNKLYSFGVNTTVTSILSTGFENVIQIIIGKYFSIAHVGFYYQAKRLQVIPYTLMNSVVQGVLYSSLVKLKNDKQRFCIAYQKLITLLFVAYGLVTTSMILLSDAMILLLYGQQWQSSSFYVIVLSIVSLFQFLEYFTNLIFKVYNQTRKILFLEIVKKILLAICLITGILSYDYRIFFYCYLFGSFIGFIINYYYTYREMIGSVNTIGIIQIIKILSCLFFPSILFWAMDKYYSFNYLLTIPFVLIKVFTSLMLLKIFKLVDFIGLIRIYFKRN